MARPKVFLASMFVVVSLLGLVFGVGMAVLSSLRLPLQLALPISLGFGLLVVLFQFFISPYLIDWVTDIRWASPLEIGRDFDLWMSQTCQQFRIPLPQFGIIEDLSPNAFTYGNTAGNARVVVTRGLINALSEDELRAVVAHELGHIKHRDFIMMTVVQAIVMSAYILFRLSRGTTRDSWYIVGISYIAYVVSYYCSLLFSRMREYMADYASAQIMQSGNELSTALVKIAYGLAFMDSKHSPIVPPDDGLASPAPSNPRVNTNPSAAQLNAALAGGSSRGLTPELEAKLQTIERDARNIDPKQFRDTIQREKEFSARSLGAFGVAGTSSIRAAVSYCNPTGALDPKNVALAARWELYNPWAKISELFSTHPLSARRIKALQDLNPRWDKPMVYDFSKVPPGKYRYFFRDLLVMAIPLLGALAGGFGAAALAGKNPSESKVVGIILMALGGYFLGWVLRLMLSYAGQFRMGRVGNLIRELQVSHVRPIPVVLHGKFTGMVESGIPWANDFIFQDETGHVACLFRKPIGFLEAWFGLFTAQSLIGREVVVYGWYRRYGGPFVEMSHFEMVDTRDVTKTGYHVWMILLSVVAAAFAIYFGLQNLV